MAQETKCTLGLDLGAATTRIALLDPTKPMPSIIRNELSNEATSTVVSYPAREARCYGEVAASKQITKVGETIVDLAPWLFCLEEGCGSASERTRIIGESSHHVVQVAAYFIKNILGFAGWRPDAEARRICFSMPMGAPPRASHDLRQACLLVGIPEAHTILVPSDEAAAVYFHHMQYTNLDDAVPVYVVIINVGHSCVNGCALAVTKGSLKKLGSRFLNMGSGSIDSALCEHVLEEIEKKHPQCQPRADAKTTRKVLQECRKTKEILTTVDETQLHLDGLKGDVDVRLPVSRALAEQCAAVFVGAFTQMLQELKTCLPGVELGLEEGQEPSSPLEPRVEVIGGGWRFPCVSQVIREQLGVSRLGVSLDAVMAVAEGSAILAEVCSAPPPLPPTDSEGGEAPSGELQANTPTAAAVRERNPIHELELVNFTVGTGENPLAQSLSPEDKQAVEEWAATESQLAAIDAAIHTRLDAINQLDSYLLQTLDAVERCEAEDSTKAAARAYLSNLDDFIRGECDEADADAIMAKLAEAKAHIGAAHPEIEAFYAKMRLTEKQKEEELVKLSQQQREEEAELKSDPQRLRMAQKRREQGQALFKEECWQEAQTRFVQSLSILGQLYDTDAAENKARKNEIALSCHLNIASCSVKLGKWRNAVNNSTSALELSPDNPKALFRRGQAQLALREYAEAVKDLEAARLLSKDEPNIVAELHRAKKALETQKAKEKKMFSKMFL